MRLYLVRHGQTDANVNGVFCGSSDVALTAMGVTQAKHVAQQLASITLDTIVHTDLARSRATAEAIAFGRSSELHVQPLLQEMCFGEWELRHHRDLLASGAAGYDLWCRDWQVAEVPLGESFAAFTQRIRLAMRQLYLMPTESCLAIVAHQGSLSLMLAMMLKLAPADMWRFPFKQGCVSEIELTNGSCVIQRLNDSGTL
ncbi:histidine phosphatase family protein [Hafnia psychrotolerans]|uniref:Adenosylcobalamin/alpha-ribazole phosphatase n=1 Tax=Hafnia psychrotolerans TaxID=1477018 RepID=A0ABQ1GA84_9GAMM|nr:histidine phosphatase family protein [Hafnia psychrotolerans]GGA39708.1 adenosylcobalamin/alpha-ribazole phosphatase [Hafnia psychrotolerans]